MHYNTAIQFPLKFEILINLLMEAGNSKISLLIIVTYHKGVQSNQEHSIPFSCYASLVRLFVSDNGAKEGSQSSTRVPPAPRAASVLRGDMTRTTQP